MGLDTHQGQSPCSLLTPAQLTTQPHPDILASSREEAFEEPSDYQHENNDKKCFWRCGEIHFASLDALGRYADTERGVALEAV